MTTPPQSDTVVEVSRDTQRLVDDLIREAQGFGVDNELNPDSVDEAACHQYNAKIALLRKISKLEEALQIVTSSLNKRMAEEMPEWVVLGLKAFDLGTLADFRYTDEAGKVLDGHALFRWMRSAIDETSHA